VIPIIFQAIKIHHGEQHTFEGNYLLALIHQSNFLIGSITIMMIILINILPFYPLCLSSSSSSLSDRQNI